MRHKGRQVLIEIVTRLFFIIKIPQHVRQSEKLPPLLTFLLNLLTYFIGEVEKANRGHPSIPLIQRFAVENPSKLLYNFTMSKNQIAEKVKRAVESDPNKDYIKSISLFGSFLHDAGKKKSDIDLLFEMRKTMSLFKIIRMQNRLEKELGQKVDFIEKNSLDKYIKDDILKEAEKIYERR